MTPDEPIRFELDRLVSYDDDSLLAEIQRVGGLIEGPIKRAAFNKVALVNSATLVAKFGSWKTALEAAGLGDRYAGPTITEKMRSTPGKSMSDADVIAEMRRVAHIASDGQILTREMIDDHATMSRALPILRFGSWPDAIDAAGLKMAPGARRLSDDDYFENLLAVWTHHGRVPLQRELGDPPSEISHGAYTRKFGSWGKAKQAFVERVNSDLAPSAAPEESPPPTVKKQPPKVKPEDRRDIPLGLRYKVLSRDRFRCAICGRSPATDLSVVLHVDHIKPFSAGGKTVEDNLRALCADCNLGKGPKIEA